MNFPTLWLAQEKQPPVIILSISHTTVLDKNYFKSDTGIAACILGHT